MGRIDDNTRTLNSKLRIKFILAIVLLGVSVLLAVSSGTSLSDIKDAIVPDVSRFPSKDGGSIMLYAGIEAMTTTLVLMVFEIVAAVICRFAANPNIDSSPIGFLVCDAVVILGASIIEATYSEQVMNAFKEFMLKLDTVVMHNKDAGTMRIPVSTYIYGVLLFIVFIPIVYGILHEAVTNGFIIAQVGYSMVAGNSESINGTLAFAAIIIVSFVVHYILNKGAEELDYDDLVEDFRDSLSVRCLNSAFCLIGVCAVFIVIAFI